MSDPFLCRKTSPGTDGARRPLLSSSQKSKSGSLSVTNGATSRPSHQTKNPRGQVYIHVRHLFKVSSTARAWERLTVHHRLWSESWGRCCGWAVTPPELWPFTRSPLGSPLLPALPLGALESYNLEFALSLICGPIAQEQTPHGLQDVQMQPMRGGSGGLWCLLPGLRSQFSHLFAVWTWQDISHSLSIKRWG